MKDLMDFNQLVILCRDTHEEIHRRAGRVADSYLAARNWMLGWYIVEFEQNGSDRADYGSGLLERLSSELGKGFSVRSLRQFRAFYLSRKSIQQTVSADFLLASKSLTESALEIRQTLSAELLKVLKLGWSQYVTLLTIDDSEERSFYEIEAAQNQWSVRELERQIKSSLYQRLALSRDKEEVQRLAKEGQVVEKATDLIKNPLVLEFLGLEEKASYSETDLESAIIDKLETFLLELGKGFLFEARQKRFTFDNDHFYVDPCPVRYRVNFVEMPKRVYLTGSIFYNRLLRCYVLIDLKRDKLTHQDLGQMQIHPVRYEILLRVCSSKHFRRQLLRGLYKRPQTEAIRTQRGTRPLNQEPPSSRASLLRGVPQPGRRYKTGEVSQDRLGQALHQDPISRLSHGVNVNYFDRHVKLDDELPTIGILLCSRKNDALVELTLPEEANIFASKYELYLPSKEELIAQLESISNELEGEST